MASSRHNSDQMFPPSDVAGELNPGNNSRVQFDPVSSEVAASQETKEQAKAKQKKNGREKEKGEALQTLKSAITISGIIVAVVGAAFAITKKLREK